MMSQTTSSKEKTLLMHIQEHSAFELIQPENLEEFYDQTT